MQDPNKIEYVGSAPSRWSPRFMRRKLSHFWAGRKAALNVPDNLSPKQMLEITDGSHSLELGRDIAVRVIDWPEPNRAQTPPLHIAKTGERFSTITGVAWLNDDLLITSHRNGLRMAIFDVSKQDNSALVHTEHLPHLTDAIAVRNRAPDKWEVAVSGCWAATCSLFYLDISDGIPNFSAPTTLHHKSRDFSHGVGYGASARLCTTVSTGKAPRIVIGADVYTLPKPWGARDICYDPVTRCYFAVAVSANPKRSAYDGVKTSIWLFKEVQRTWNLLTLIDDVHSDACDTYSGCVWISDQHNDQVLGICMETGALEYAIKGSELDFPHGLAVGRNGMMAVTNYGNSSLALFDVSKITKR